MNGEDFVKVLKSFNGSDVLSASSIRTRTGIHYYKLTLKILPEMVKNGMLKVIFNAGKKVYKHTGKEFKK